MSTFDTFNLPDLLKRSLAKLNFATPTPVQAEAIPLALEGHDIIASAQTGSGKTAAFGIPLIAKLLADKTARALILAPTRELAGQIAGVIEDLSQGDRTFRPVVLIGGVSMYGQVRGLRSSPRVIIATPGRLVDHLSQMPNLLREVKFLVLDEADRMLDMGFAPQLREVMKRVPDERQTFLFSATYPSDIQSLAAQLLRDPKRVTIHSVVRPVEAIEQRVLELDEGSKTGTLVAELKQRGGSVIVFTRTKRRADKLTRDLLQKGESACQIHGGRSQRQREAALHGFRGGKIRVLVATDIAARGIDVPEIEHVINFDLPFVAEDYLHRIGRTARAGRSGKALCLVAPHERTLWRAIERLMSRRGGRSSVEQREESQALRRELKSAEPRERREFGGQHRGNGRSNDRSNGNGRSNDRYNDRRNDRGNGGSDRGKARSFRPQHGRRDDRQGARPERRGQPAAV